jgi:hypothetical protein
MDYLSFKSALSSLLESEKELKSLVDRGKVTQEQYDDILDSLPEKLEKYAGWIGKNINDTEASINHIIDLLDWFENNKNKLDEKDINKYTVDSLQSTFDKVIKQEYIKRGGAKLIKETNKYLLYEIYDHNACLYYGAGTKWRTTIINANNPNSARRAWDRYKEDGAKFMFLINKNDDINDIYYKVAIPYIDKDGVRYILAAFDSSNNQINNTTLKSITKSVDDNWNYNYFEDEVWFGDVPIDIMPTENILNIVVKGIYTIQSDGTVDVNGDVKMLDMDLNKIPVKFGKVTGYFDCSRNQLTSLDGAPQSVGRDFFCADNKLTSLDGAPQLVGKGFHCSDNQLTSLVGAPQSVGSDFDCSNNQLTSLKGAPQSVLGYFHCSDNQLTSLVGAPQSVGSSFYCSNNKVKFTENDVTDVSYVQDYIIT